MGGDSELKEDSDSDSPIQKEQKSNLMEKLDTRGNRHMQAVFNKYQNMNTWEADGIMDDDALAQDAISSDEENKHGAHRKRGKGRGKGRPMVTIIKEKEDKKDDKKRKRFPWDRKFIAENFAI